MQPISIKACYCLFTIRSRLDRFCVESRAELLDHTQTMQLFLTGLNLQKLRQLINDSIC